MKTLNYAFCLLTATAWLSSCNSNDAGKTSDKKEKVCISDSLAKIIHIDTAGIANVDDELKLSGEVSFNDNKVVKVFPFSSGQVVEVKVSLGDKVSKGQTLAVIKKRRHSRQLQRSVYQRQRRGHYQKTNGQYRITL